MSHVPIAYSDFCAAIGASFIWYPDLSPYQGEPFFLRVPGLKPWAEFCSPCGAGPRSTIEPNPGFKVETAETLSWASTALTGTGSLAPPALREWAPVLLYEILAATPAVRILPLPLVVAQRPTAKGGRSPDGDKILSITSERDNGGWLPWFGRRSFGSAPRANAEEIRQVNNLS